MNEGNQPQVFRERLELAELVQPLRSGFDETKTISHRRLGHSLYVRRELERHGAIQGLTDEGIVSVVVEPNRFNALLEYVTLLENQLEQAKRTELTGNRKWEVGFRSHNHFTAQALGLFDDMEDVMQKVLDEQN